MKWTTQQFDKDRIDAAGRALVGHTSELSMTENENLAIVNNWRSSHAFPLNTMQVYLRRRSRQIDPTSLVSQRVKRLSSIESKLQRLGWLSLSQMQDLGGCRAVVASVANVERIVASYRESQIKHKLLNRSDYISDPKTSGYRGYHLIYGYHSDKKATYNGLKIEIQIRSNLQHIWATAVEAVGTFTRQALKSSQGEHDWLRFFALMSTYFAIREKRPIVSNTTDQPKSLGEELRYLEKKLDVRSRLSAYGATLNVTDEISRTEKVRYFLLNLDLDKKSIRISGFRFTELEKASGAYLEAERALMDGINGDVVLVSVESLESLKRAYPNYFLDTSRFGREVYRALRYRRGDSRP